MAIVKLNQDFAFNIKDMLTHTSILGASGTGKTTTLKKIINTIHDTKNVLQIVLDNKGDLMDSFEGESVAKYDCMRTKDIKQLCIPVGLIPINKISELIGLTENATNILIEVFKDKKTIKDKYFYNAMVTFENLEDVVSNYEFHYADNKSMFDRLSMKQLLTKLKVAKNKFDKFTYCKKGVFFSSLIDENKKLIIINTQGMDKDAYKLLNLFLTERLLDDYKDEHESPRCLLYIDEAHNAFDKIAETSLDNYSKITKEGRSKGVGLILITQHLSHIPETILENINNLIQHGINNVINDKAINSVSKMFEIVNGNHPETRKEGTKAKTFKGRIMNLEVGECFARFAGSPITQIKIEI